MIYKENFLTVSPGNVCTSKNQQFGILNMDTLPETNSNFTPENLNATGVDDPFPDFWASSAYFQGSTSSHLDIQNEGDL